MSEIQEKIKNFNDDFLLEQFFNQSQEYTEEAVELMEKEIALRDLDTSEYEIDEEKEREMEQYAQEDFTALDNGFNQVDLLIVRELLLENDVPFLVDTSGSSSALPIETEATHTYSVRVPESLMEKAKALIDEQFHSKDGVYAVKYDGIKDRLKAVNFFEIDLKESELQELLEVSFSSEESTLLCQYLEKLNAEADAIEQEQERVLFFFDNIEECLQRLQDTENNQFSRADLLTLLETCQIYCDQDSFPQQLESTIEALLSFFAQQ